MGRTSNSYLNLTILTNYPTGEETSLESENKFSYDSKIISNQYVKSLFSPRTTEFKFWPSGNKDGNAQSQPSSYPPHTDSIYQINPSEIVKWSQKQSLGTRLSASDFAYLKNIGVYPNNRIIIARRFAGPVGNDLSIIDQKPLAVLIDWVKEDGDFFEITYGEEWVDADASFETILNNIGEASVLSTDNKSGMAVLGTKLAAGVGALPLPGLTEALQYNLFKELGIVSTDSPFKIPTGDPNLIREAKRRKTLGKGLAGSGLKCNFSVKMTVEYEQKFINGVDPTIVYFDIIANALSFATSPAVFQFNNKFYNDTTSVLKNFISGNIANIKEGLVQFLGALLTALGNTIGNLSESIFGNTKTNSNQSNQEKANSIKTNTSGLIGKLLEFTLGAVIEKYKVALLGVISSLTGVNSTPWHVTIGNPKRPYFSSGDMYVDDVKMSMGSVLAFNDLPSTIKLDLTLKPARNIGADEIFDRFNIGKGRSYTRPADVFYNTQFSEEDTKDITQKVKDAQNKLISNQFNKEPNFVGSLATPKGENAGLSK